MFVNKAGKILAALCNWMPFTWLQFLLLSVNMLFLTSSNFIVFAVGCWNSRGFFLCFFCFQFLMQRWKICSFYFYRKYLQFFQEAIWMQIFLLLSRGDLQVDVFSLWVWAQPEAALHTSPELCQGKLAQWHWGQFKAISFSIMWNLAFLVLSDKSSENDFIFTLFKLLKYFFS